MTRRLSQKQIRDQLIAKLEPLARATANEYKDSNVRVLPTIAYAALRSCIIRYLVELRKTVAPKAVRRSIEEYLKGRLQPELVSLDSAAYVSDDGSSIALRDTIRDTKSPSPELLAELNEASELAEDLLRRFPEPTRTILKARWLWPYFDAEFNSRPSFRQIGEAIDVSEEQVERIYKRAIQFLEDVREFGRALKVPEDDQDSCGGEIARKTAVA